MALVEVSFVMPFGCRFLFISIRQCNDLVFVDVHIIQQSGNGSGLVSLSQFTE